MLCFDKPRLGNKAKLRDDAALGKNAMLRDDATLGDNATLGDDATLIYNWIRSDIREDPRCPSCHQP